MKKRLYVPLLATAVIAALLILGACSREQSFETGGKKVTVREDGKKVDVKTENEEFTLTGDEKAGRVKIKTKEGETTLSYNEGQLADGFPRDIPIYVPSKVTISQVMDNGKNIMAQLTTDAEPAQIAQFYKKALVRTGWKIETETAMGDLHLFQGEKSGKVLNVTINKDKEQNQTIISLAEEKP